MNEKKMKKDLEEERMDAKEIQIIGGGGGYIGLQDCAQHSKQVQEYHSTQLDILPLESLTSEAQVHAQLSLQAGQEIGATNIGVEPDSCMNCYVRREMHLIPFHDSLHMYLSRALQTQFSQWQFEIVHGQTGPLLRPLQGHAKSEWQERATVRTTKETELVTPSSRAMCGFWKVPIR